ncbi:S1 family peptidase [Microvirga massiliensis]|uniref:S1 family peptidase n=1 Tax=Microvirga massiliensis TaxID=1033741 RepID=UPI0007C830A2|nr:S1 family peptidase [Microvirga massiliensis]
MKKLSRLVHFSLTAMFCSVLAVPAGAVVGGRVSRDPDGLRRAVVRVENSAGELCTGILVRPDVVLTAAHCVVDAAAYKVVGVDRRFRAQAVGVSAALLHPTFVQGTTPRTQPGVDLALLGLRQPLGSSFQPIDLAGVTRIGTGEFVTLAGFGVTRERAKGTARVLRETQLVALGPVRVRNHVFVVADPDRLAESDGAGACRGDSGGPLLVETAFGPRLVGIVSWSSGAMTSRQQTACGGLTAITPIQDHLQWVVDGTMHLSGQNWTSASGSSSAKGRGISR